MDSFLVSDHEPQNTIAIFVFRFIFCLSFSAFSSSPLPEQNLLCFFGHPRRRRVNGLCQRVGTLHCFASLDCFEPALEVRKVIEILALPLMEDDPRIASHISNRIFSGGKLAIGEPFIEHSVEALGFLDIALDRIGQLLVRVVSKVMILAEHRPQPAHLPKEPLHDLRAAAQIGGQKLAGLLSEILKNSTGLEDADRLAAASRFVVDDRRNAVVGRNR